MAIISMASLEPSIPGLDSMLHTRGPLRKGLAMSETQ